jgi:hypothetical protein
MGRSMPRWHLAPACNAALAVLMAVHIACSGTQPTLRGESPAPEAPAQPSNHGLRTYDLVLASGGERDCHAEQLECFRRCWNSTPPWPRPRGSARHHNYCTEKCLKEYMECVKQTEAQPLMFPDLKTAREWLEGHKAGVLVGSIVLGAGVAFVVGTAGAGVLVLVPLAAL